jgi:hypothetical protein
MAPVAVDVRSTATHSPLVIASEQRDIISFDRIAAELREKFTLKD